MVGQSPGSDHHTMCPRIEIPHCPITVCQFKTKKLTKTKKKNQEENNNNNNNNKILRQSHI
jgi:hypothetical protein